MNINKKQKIFVLAIVLIMLISIIVFAWQLEYAMREHEKNDDILGSTMDFTIGVLFILPYFFSLLNLMYGGYNCLSFRPFSKSKILYLMSVVLSIAVVLYFCTLFFFAVFNDSSIKLVVYERICTASYVISCMSFLFDVLGTVMKKH